MCLDKYNVVDGGGRGGSVGESKSDRRATSEQMSYGGHGAAAEQGRQGRARRGAARVGGRGAKRCRMSRVNVEQAAPSLRPLCDLAPAVSAVPTAVST